MRQKKGAAFASMGVRLKTNYSWSAISDDHERVVVQLWDFLFDKANPDVYDEELDPLIVRDIDTRNARERRSHLEHAIANLGGLIHVVIGYPESPDASPRKTREAEATDIVMKIENISPLRARAVSS